MICCTKCGKQLYGECLFQSLGLICCFFVGAVIIFVLNREVDRNFWKTFLECSWCPILIFWFFNFFIISCDSFGNQLDFSVNVSTVVLSSAVIVFKGSAVKNNMCAYVCPLKYSTASDFLFCIHFFSFFVIIFVHGSLIQRPIIDLAIGLTAAATISHCQQIQLQYWIANIVTTAAKMSVSGVCLRNHLPTNNLIYLLNFCFLSSFLLLFILFESKSL